MFDWMTSAFSKVNDTIRARIANSIKASSDDPKPTIRKINADWKDRSTASMLAHAQLKSHSFLKSDAIVQYITDDPDSLSHWTERSEMIADFQGNLESTPFVSTHLIMLNTILGLLNETHLDLEDAMTPTEFMTKFIQAVTAYLETCQAWFDAKDFPDLKTYQSDWWKREIWSYSVKQPTANYLAEDSKPHPQAQEHQDMIASIVNELINSQVPDEIVLYILTPTLASAGYAWFSEGDHTTYLNFMPYEWITHGRDEIWNLRMQNKFEDDEEYYDPKDIDSSELEAKETAEFDDVADNSLDSIEVPQTGSQKSKRPPMDEQAPGTSQSKGKKRKQKQNAKADDDDTTDAPSPPPPPPTQPPQPQVPDDTAYVPDAFLSRKVRDLTAHFQGLQAMDMVHDHMTRFTTTNEQPVPITRWQVQRTDSRTFAGQSTLSRMYVVTYTRANRKPIFNPVG